MKNKKTIQFILSIVAASLMVQTLYFKFTASQESVYIFTTLGMEPHGRIAIGILELIASICILFPTINWFGAILTMGLMSGAIFFHLTKLGVIVMEDGGQLFIYSIIVLIRSSIIGLINRQNIPIIKKYIK